MKALITFFNSKELCEFLNISNSSLTRLRRDKEIPFYKLGTEYRYSFKEIEKWLKTKKVA